MSPLEGVVFIQGDLEHEETMAELKQKLGMKPVDVVLSDMAPNFMGDKDIDHLQITKLNFLALSVAMDNLRFGGSLLMKTLMGFDEKKNFVG